MHERNLEYVLTKTFRVAALSLVSVFERTGTIHVFVTRGMAADPPSKIPLCESQSRKSLGMQVCLKHG
jgi:hypothetical protein